jgi:hypothetical protein
MDFALSNLPNPGIIDALGDRTKYVVGSALSLGFSRNSIANDRLQIIDRIVGDRS